MHYTLELKPKNERSTVTDLQLLMDQYNKLIDVTIVHPTCPSHLKQAQHQLQTAKIACEQKTRKYSHLVSSMELILFLLLLRRIVSVSKRINR